MNSNQDNAIRRAAQRLEQKPLPLGFEARMTARLERQQRREELQESTLFVSGVVATIALLVWAGLHYAPMLDFSFFDFELSLGKNWHWPNMSFIENLSNYRIFFIMGAATMGLLLADTYIRLKSQAKDK